MGAPVAATPLQRRRQQQQQLGMRRSPGRSTKHKNNNNNNISSIDINNDTPRRSHRSPHVLLAASVCPSPASSRSPSSVLLFLLSLSIVVFVAGSLRLADAAATASLLNAASSSSGGASSGSGPSSSSSSTSANGTRTREASFLVGRQQFPTTLMNLVLDETSNQVIIGAKNHLYQLDDNMRLLQDAVTGPRNDSDDCTFVECPHDSRRELKNNFNKVLLVNGQSLIVCGTLYQGVCELRTLRNVSAVEQQVHDAVVANNEASSTFAFVAPGPPTSANRNVLYVGVTFTGNSPYRSEIPAVASRSLEKNRMFQIAATAVTTGTRVIINNSARESYLVNYVYGFSSDGFSYFLTTQPKHTTGHGGGGTGTGSAQREHVTKLVRICQDDANYYSYTEIPVECTSGTKRYNLVQGGVLGKPGADLAGHLQVTVNDDVLYAVFVEENSTTASAASSSTTSGDASQSHHGHHYANISIEADRQYNSAVCVFSMKAIRRTFMENIKKCFNGQGERGLDFLSPSMKCVSTKLQTISEDFCGLDVNSPLGGDMPITALPIHVYHGRRLTGAILTDAPNSAQVIFIADSEGHIMKLIFDEKQQQAIEYDRIDVVGAQAPLNGNSRNRKPTLAPVTEDGASSSSGGREFISNRGMIYDKYRRFLYAITQTRLHKIRIANCALADNCQQCLAKRDPYCGWCSLENKCTEKSECRNDYWVNGKSGKCTQITQVLPKELQRTTARTLELIIENLPVVSAGEDMKLVCVFDVGGNKVLTTDATRKRNGVNCTTPRTDLLPPIAPGENAIVAELSVQKVGGPKLVATNFTFFDCSTHLSCTVCVSSKYPCDWCVEAHRCTHDTADNCRNDILVTGVSRAGPSYRSGPTFCPTINSTGTESNEILVSSGTKKGIKVRVHIIGQFIVQTRFVCQFNIEGRVTSANAQLLGDTIYCDPIEFLYTSRSPNLTATFAVIWGGSKPLDNPNNIHILIYRCRDMASNCGECLGLDEKFNCGWCSSSNTCEISEQCGTPSSGAGRNDWLDRNEVCPNPQITSFHPLTGPWEGGTNITIQGVNLGKNFSDIYSGVTIAGISCQPYEKLYVKTKEIVCQVEGPGVQKYHPGKIVVQIRNYRGESKTNYQFVDPVIRDFAPKFGPRSGGTTLTIYGDHLNAGSLIQAFIDDLPCEILSVEHSKAQCKTSEFNGVLNEQQQQQYSSDSYEGPAEDTFITVHRGMLKMKFDTNSRELTNQHFDYVVDPVISMVTSNALRMPLKPQEMPTVKFPRGVPAGGLQVHVYGKNFNSIQEPKFIVRYGGREFINHCKINSTEYMVCYTPEIDVDSDDSSRIEQLESEQPILMEYNLELDGVRNVFDKTVDRRTFELYSNPEYFPFDDNVKFYKSEYLTINGKNLDNAAKTSDVRIMIGPYECNVTSLSHGQLTCRPPSTEFIKQQKDEEELAASEGRPLDADAYTGIANADKDQYFVVVKIGNSDNIVYKIGILSYKPPNSISSWSSASLIIIIAVVGVVVLICFIVLIVQYRRKTTESNRVLKNMQDQMDILELRVAAECKEAFAELQTEMTDLTTDLISSGGIPFLDYKHYIIKILFPDQQQSYYFLDLEKNMSSTNGELLLAKERGLRLFGQLVMNKTFLLLFIRTLETNRYFSMRERVNVASLIMVTLQSKLEYCTEILKTLLADLIEKCMTDGKSHPRLLLRRTESVAEKMLSAWFTFLLYKFLRECAGEPLYMLFRAVKGQLEKGPIDAITSEARYSLSEEKLIRQLIDFKAITIYVSINQQIQQSHHQIQTQVYSDEESETLLLQQNPQGVGQFTLLSDNIPVKVLDCDSIGEIKEKCLDHIYKNTPFSQRPQQEDLDLEWRTGNQGRMILYDEDQTSSKVDYDWKKLNTLAHYRIPDGANLALIPKQSSIYNSVSGGGGGNTGTISEPNKKTLLRGASRAISPPLLSSNNKHLDLILNTNNQQQIPSTDTFHQFIGQNQNLRYFHLVKHDENGNDNYNQKDSSKQNDGQTKDSNSNGINFSSLNNQKDDHNRVNKMVSEIYLTRLLAMKGVLQKFVDDLFETIFSTAHRGSALPLAIKYMFDFLDDQAQLHGITDPEVVHTWKSNSLPLRFWVNLIKNPNFIFDIHKSNTVDSCLSVVAQTFMDSCSTSGHRLGKDSPSSKLLYAKDIPNYRKWVERYYADIRDMPAISDQDMNAMLAEESRLHTTEFNTNCALHELYTYAVKYNEQLTVTLEEDEFSQKQRLAYKLEQVHNIMSQ